MHRVLLSEPSAAIATAIRVVLEHDDFAVDVVAEANEVRARDLSPYAAIVIDVHREQHHGLEVIEWLYRTRSDLMGRVVVITGDDPAAVREALHTAGVCDVVVKPVSASEILRAVLDCLEKNPAFTVN